MADQLAEWIRASEAFEFMAARGKDPGAIAGTLAFYLREGRLRSRAKAIWISKEPSLRKAWKEGRELKDLQEIPVAYWRSEKNLIDDRARWRWRADRFFMTLRMKPRKRRMMRGVEFWLEDLKLLQPTYFHDKYSKGSRGPDYDREGYHKGYGYLISLAVTGQLNQSKFKTQTNLAGYIHDGCVDTYGPRVVGEHKCHEIAGKVWPHLPEAE